MVAETGADEALAPLLTRLNLSKYIHLLVDEEELTADLLRTMKQTVALDSLLEVGMDQASATSLCNVIYGGGADAAAAAVAVDDYDALVMEENHAGVSASGDDDALIIEDNSAPEKAPVDAPAAPTGRNVKAESLEARYKKWEALADDDDDDEAMDDAIRERGEYEVVEKAVYCLAQPSTKATILDVKHKGARITTDARTITREDGKTFEWVRSTTLVPAKEKRGKESKPWLMVDGRQLGRPNVGVLLKKIVSAPKPAPKQMPSKPSAWQPPPPKPIPASMAAAQAKKAAFDYSKWDTYIDEQHDLELHEEKPREKPNGYHSETLVGLNPQVCAYHPRLLSSLAFADTCYPLLSQGAHSLGRGWSDLQDGPGKEGSAPKGFGPPKPGPSYAGGRADKNPIHLSAPKQKKSMFASDAPSASGEERVEDVSDAAASSTPPIDTSLSPQGQQLQAMAQGFDMSEYQKGREAELEESKKRFGASFTDEQLRTEQIMRDAKQQGNQGNLVMDRESGKLVIKTDDQMGGRAKRYWWGQNEREVTIKCEVDASTRSKAVRLTSKSQSIHLEVGGDVLAEGPLLHPVIADETLFTLDELPGGEKKLLTVTMLKAEPTKGQKHWTCAIKGQAKIDKSSFGVETTTINPNDPEEMKRTLASMK